MNGGWTRERRRAEREAAVEELRELRERGDPAAYNLDLLRRASGRCLKPCEVASSEHPGYHVPSSAGDLEGEPMCPLPAGHESADGGFRAHMCAPDDYSRYAWCPEPGCGRLVAKRALKHHVAAHDPTNRRDPDELRRDRLAAILAAQDAFAAANPGWPHGAKWGNLTAEAALYRYQAKARKGNESKGYRDLVERACDAAGEPRPPFTLKQAKKVKGGAA